MRSMTINLREGVRDDFLITNGASVEFYLQLDNFEGWIDAFVKEIRGEFYLVEYSTDHKTHTKILTRNNIRPKTNVSETFELNTSDNEVLMFNLDYLKNKKSKKIENIIDQIKNLVEVNFIYYSRGANLLLVFIEKGNDCEKIELLNKIMETVKEHFIEFEQLREELFKIEEKTEKVQVTKKKRNSKTEEKDFDFSSSINLEKFIFDMLKNKIESYKKTPSVKIEYKNTKDPNVIKIEIKSNNQNMLNNIYDEVNIIQRYLSLNISEKDRFFLDEEGLSLKHFVNMFKINSYRIFKLDDENVSLQLIGPEKAIILVSNLVEEYVTSEKNLRLKESEYKKLMEGKDTKNK